jgi:hypothetical protein
VLSGDITRQLILRLAINIDVAFLVRIMNSAEADETSQSAADGVSLGFAEWTSASGPPFVLPLT